MSHPLVGIVRSQRFGVVSSRKPQRQRSRRANLDHTLRAGIRQRRPVNNGVARFEIIVERNAQSAVGMQHRHRVVAGVDQLQTTATVDGRRRTTINLHAIDPERATERGIVTCPGCPVTSQAGEAEAAGRRIKSQP